MQARGRVSCSCSCHLLFPKHRNTQEYGFLHSHDIAACFFFQPVFESRSICKSLFVCVCVYVSIHGDSQRYIVRHSVHTHTPLMILSCCWLWSSSVDDCPRVVVDSMAGSSVRIVQYIAKREEYPSTQASRTRFSKSQILPRHAFVRSYLGNSTARKALTSIRNRLLCSTAFQE